MIIERINPGQLYDSVGFGFSHATLQHGGRTLHLAGQVAWDADGALVGKGDLVAQARQALANLTTVLAAIGATPADVVRLRTYVVDHDASKLMPVTQEIMRFFGEVAPSPNTLIGVQALALPEFLIEIEATAAIA